jgi:hypothetical protein
LANLSITIAVNSPASTGITFTPAAPFTGSGSAFATTGPVASGITVGSISVAPAGWQGALALSGANAASFSLSGFNLITAAALPDAVYNISLTATP